MGGDANGPAERTGRNYIVVSADTHASPDSLEHFLSYVDPARREAVAAREPRSGFRGLPLGVEGDLGGGASLLAYHRRLDRGHLLDDQRQPARRAIDLHLAVGQARLREPVYCAIVKLAERGREISRREFLGSYFEHETRHIV